ncbi:hypothetical protein BDD12DRAFT_911208 [Trichophaea hybrida]|nr:hypothetical protein BDD12DRAFT_911208 [Trichophaea hybrida]
MKILRSNLSKKELSEIQNQDLSALALVISISVFQKRQNEDRTTKFVERLDQQFSRIERLGNAMNVLVSYNPSPAALQWGSVLIVLKLVHDLADEYERLLSTLVDIVQHLPHIEQYGQTFSESDLVQQSLSAAYASILLFWVKAMKFYRRRRLWNIFRTVWTNYDLEFKSLESTLLKNRETVENAAHLEHITAEKTERVAQEDFRQEERTIMLEEKSRQLVRWLSPVNCEPSYYMDSFRRNHSLCHPGTCRWILDKQEFREWPSSTNLDILWVSTTPGTGNSVLASWIVDFLQDHYKSDDDHNVLYFFIDNKDEDKNTPVAVLRSLVYQAYEKSISVQDDELHSELAASLQKSDALDGLVSPELVLRSLVKLSRRAKVKLFATSRRDQNIVEELETADHIIVTEVDVTNDIRSFVTWEVFHDGRLSQQHLKDLVINALMRRNRGMFLWVDLMIKELKSATSTREIRKTLEDLPVGLEAVYSRIFRRLSDSLLPSPRQLCQRVLLWILHATRPLNLAELEQALILEATHTQDYSRKGLISVCGSLVSVNAQRNTIQLIHQTTKEYLISQCTEVKKRDIEKEVQGFLVDPDEANSRIASCCLKYFQRQGLGGPLSEDRFRNTNIDEACQQFHFLDYASLNWSYHLSHIRSQSNSIKSTTHSVSTYCFSSRSLTWMEVVLSLKGPDTLLSLLRQPTKPPATFAKTLYSQSPSATLLRFGFTMPHKGNTGLKETISTVVSSAFERSEILPISPTDVSTKPTSFTSGFASAKPTNPTSFTSGFTSGFTSLPATKFMTEQEFDLFKLQVSQKYEDMKDSFSQMERNLFRKFDNDQEATIQLQEKVECNEEAIAKLQKNETILREEIRSLKKQVEEVKTTVGILLKEQKAMQVELDGLRASAVAPTPPEKKKMIRPTPTQVLKRNLAKRKEESRREAETDSEQEHVEGRPSKAPRIVSPPKSLMYSKHAVGAGAVEQKREDGRAQARKSEEKKKSETGWTEVKRKRGPRGPGTKATKIEDGRGYTLVWDTPTGRYESWRPYKRELRQQGGDGERR